MPIKKTSPTKTKSKTSVKTHKHTPAKHEMQLEVFYMALIFITISSFLVLAVNNTNKAEATNQAENTQYNR